MIPTDTGVVDQTVHNWWERLLSVEVSNRLYYNEPGKISTTLSEWKRKMFNTPRLRQEELEYKKEKGEIFVQFFDALEKE